MAFTIQCNPSHNYDDIINILNSELEIPTSTTNISEAILNILMGTRQIREGSKPSIDYQYNSVMKIKEAIERKEKISVVIPAGPKKPGLEGDYVDLAELWFMKILYEIGRKVHALYEHGIVFHIILEDASMAIFEPEIPRSLADSYHRKLSRLVYVLGYTQYIDIVPESQLITAHELDEVSQEIFPSIIRFLEAGVDIPQKIEALNEMKELGWQGGISEDTLEFYYHSFSKNYPGKTLFEIRHHIARYLSVSYARYKLSARSITSHDIVAGNAKRVPGVGFDKYSRIFYRTVPLYKTKTHIPFWRARGIIQTEGNEHTTKLVAFSDPVDTEKTVVALNHDERGTAYLRIDLIV